MDIKILTSILPLEKCSPVERNIFVIGTHNGMFHADEVVAIAILCLFHKNEKIWIVRTQDNEVLNNCDICVDIGGGEYDHHNKSFCFIRKNGTAYASSGLIWKDFGRQLLDNYTSDIFFKTFNTLKGLIECSETIWNQLDDELFSLVDAEDNGIDDEKHIFSYISSFIPSWYNFETGADMSFEIKFLKVLNITIEILQEKIDQTISTCFASKLIQDRLTPTSVVSLEQLENGEGYFSDNILELPCQNIPWVETITNLKEYSIDFVIFRSPSGGWAAQCVPPSLEKRFKQRIPFPKEWAGKTDTLPEISGVPDATFCHNGCFLVRAKTKKGVIQMCKLAMQQNKK